MARPEKVQAVAEIKERLESAEAVFLAEYAGLSVTQQQQLRRSLKEQGAEFKVVKMTLARLAAAQLEITDLDELLLGPTGLAFADGDPVPAAKALKEFAKAHEVFQIKGGLLGSDFLSPERISELAEIPPRPVLLSKTLGLTQAPMANLIALTSAVLRNTATLFQQLEEKRAEEGAVAEASSEAPEEAAESPDTAASETEAALEEPVAEEEVPAGAEAPAEEPAAEKSEPEQEADDAGSAEEVEADAGPQDSAEEEDAEEEALVAEDEADAETSDDEQEKE